MPTKKGHMIADFALKKGKQHEMQEVLFNAYFTRTLSEEVLKELVAEVGLDPAEAMAALSDPHYLRQFEKGLQRASANGIMQYFYLAIIIAQPFNRKPSC